MSEVKIRQNFNHLDNAIPIEAEIFSPKQVFHYHKGLIGKVPIIRDTTVIGVEIELENVSRPPTNNLWTVVDDGSLKIEGAEFVTKLMQAKYLEIALHFLFQSIPKATSSKRCSTHIHMDVRDFTHQELIMFLIIYCMFERHLYRLSGDRNNNNFCVPLYDVKELITSFLKYVSQGELIKHCLWSKYTGLNLIPIWGGSKGKNPQGSVEFRHLKGTTNIREILDWVNTILSMKDYVKKNIDSFADLIQQLKLLNTSSGYYYLAKQVFPLVNVEEINPYFKDDIEKGITFVKDVLFSPENHILSLLEEENKEVPIFI